jgi:hypothetical protein
MLLTVRAHTVGKRGSLQILVVAMALTVFYAVLKLRQMQMTFDAKCPPKSRQIDLKAA